MKTQFHAIIRFSLILCAVQPAAAQLPSLSAAPWFGFFVGQQTAGCTLGVTSEGQIVFNPTKGSESPAGGWSFTFRPAIEEVTPDGKVVRRELDLTTLESAQPAEDQIEKLVFTGKVQGGAKMEVTVELNRNNFLIGGRVVDPGPSQNAKRFILVGRSPRFYGSYDDRGKAMTDEQKAVQDRQDKAREKKVKGENLELKLLNGQTVKQSILEPADIASAEINGIGISEIGMNFQMFRGSNLRLIASPNSAFTLNFKKDARIFKGEIYMYWRTDPEKDPQGKARMAISAK